MFAISHIFHAHCMANEKLPQGCNQFTQYSPTVLFYHFVIISKPIFILSWWEMNPVDSPLYFTTVIG